MNTPPLTLDSPLRLLLTTDRGRGLLEEVAPLFVGSPRALAHADLPIKSLASVLPQLGGTLAAATATLQRIIDESNEGVIDKLTRTPDQPPARHLSRVAAANEFQLVRAPDTVKAYEVASFTFVGPEVSDQFRHVDIQATVTGPGTKHTIGGFYCGNNQYRVNIMPGEAGTWVADFTVNGARIPGGTTTFAVLPSTSKGIVEADGFHFRYSNGENFRPVGTTAYAWVHQAQELRSQTLASLEQSPFNKLRMTVFPKHYLYNTNEPELYPFEKTSHGFDYSHPYPPFFDRIETAVQELQRRDIQCDLILFHPYDRWGYSQLTPEDSETYVRYVVRRLAAYSNIWWAVANEFDMIWSKDEDEWDRIGHILTEEDPYGHLKSIHNCFRFFDHKAKWITHASTQRIDVYRTSENVDSWRREWGKPVVVDECGYEGNVDQGWGNLLGEELIRRCWEGAVRGGYVGHGESFLDPDDVLWWAKGGTLKGEAPRRMAFLDSLIEASPRGRWDPLESPWDTAIGGTPGEYLIQYLGFGRPGFRTVTLPEGSWKIDVIDTWQCSITPAPGHFRREARVELPSRPYMAIRMQKVAP